MWCDSPGMQSVSVRAVLWLEGSDLRMCQLFFLDVGSVGEQLFFLFSQGGLVNLPESVSFGGIYNASSVGSKVDASFLFGSVCNLFGRFIFSRSDEYISMKYKCYLLAIGDTAISVAPEDFIW